MRYAKVNMEGRVEILNGEGDRFLIGPGEINGILDTEGFVDSQRGVSEGRGYLEVCFSFTDAEGVGYVYRNALFPWVLWPSEPIRVRPAAGEFAKRITLKMLLDTRDTAPIRFVNGTELVNRHKYNDVTFELQEEERSLAVRATVYIGELVCSNEPSYAAVDYEVPLERLLWRKAPVIAVDDVMPEGENYVPIIRKTTGCSQGVTPSPIVVMPRARA